MIITCANLNFHLNIPG